MGRAMVRATPTPVAPMSVASRVGAGDGGCGHCVIVRWRTCNTRRASTYGSARMAAPIVEANWPILTYIPPNFTISSTARSADRSWKAARRASTSAASAPSHAARALMARCSR